MTPLAIIITDRARTATALRLAAAAAALSRPVALLFDGSAVSELAAATPPLLSELIALGVSVTACQTGLADAALDARDLADGIQTGGMIGFLAENPGAQIILA